MQSLMSFTFTYNPQLYWLEMPLSIFWQFACFFSNSRMGFFLKQKKNPCNNKHVRDHTFLTSTLKENGQMRGVSKFVTYVQILFFLNKRSIVHFCRLTEWGTGHGGQGSQNWSFFVGVINLWPLNDLKLQPIQLLEVTVSFLLHYKATS